MASRSAGVLDAYRDRRMLIVLAMGFSSGLPLALTGTTLAFWLSSVGVQKTEIGLFHLTGLAYLFKFLWSPLFDHWAAPWLGSRLGRRRAWGIVTQLGLIAALAFVALFVAGCGASPADMIVGKWEAGEAGIKITAEFAKDGKATLTMPKPLGKVEGTYKVNGDELEWTMGGKTTKQKIKVTGTELEVTGDDKKTVKYKKV